MAGQAGGRAAPPRPANLVARAGDRSAVLHWDAGPAPARYVVFREVAPSGAAVQLTAKPLAQPRFADFAVTNGVTYRYRVEVLAGPRDDGEPPRVSDQTHFVDEAGVTATPRAFANDAEFLELLEATAFDYFWREANPARVFPSIM